MEIKINSMINLADVLEIVQLLSKQGIHFTHNNKDVYYFEIDKNVDFKYDVSIQSLTRNKVNDFSKKEPEKVNWNPCFSWLMKVPSFCYRFEMYKFACNKNEDKFSYNKKLFNISNTLCEATLFGIETIIYIFIFFCFPAFLPNFFLYYFGLLLFNILFYKVINKMLIIRLKKKLEMMMKAI